MQFPSEISIVILSILFLGQILSRSFFVRCKRWIWWGSAVCIFAGAGVLAWAQYEAWAAGGIGKYILRDVGYFISYVGHRIFGSWIVSFLSGALLGYGAHRLNRRYGERFFEEEEPWMFAVGTFAAGFPGFLVYITLLFSSGIALTLAYALLHKGRAPLYWLWLPLAILAILISNWYVPREILVRFNL